MTKQVTERELVLAILMEVTQQNVYSHLALNSVLEKYQYLEKKERAFITRVTEGYSGAYDRTGLYFESVFESESQ